MKIIDEIIDKDVIINKYLDAFKITNSDIDYDAIKNEEVIFFDIETTGLNVAKTSLYLIGYVYYKDSKWHYCQLFGMTVKDEESILNKFKTICCDYKYLIHFNGDHFDIPYINEKCNKYGIEHFLDNLISIDIYTLVKMFKPHLGLKNCKQKTIEDLLGITREDKFNGGELIPQYFEYMKSNDETLEKNLLLHNAEDCMGMLKLLDITDYIKLVKFISQGNYKLRMDHNKSSESFCFSIIPNDMKELDEINLRKFQIRNYKITIEYDRIGFETIIYEGELKHFFSDYQNYYYVIDKDMAMHKSVAKYIDSSNRQKAKASNCYVRKSGIFIPVFGEVSNDLTFKTDNKSTNNYILFISDNEIKNVDDILNSIAESLIHIGD